MTTLPYVKRNKVAIWLSALRIHQWVKNLLIFIPLLASHQLNNIDLLAKGLLAFLFFGLCASSAYVLNDLLDLAHDRSHSTKKFRAFAAGELSPKVGFFISPLLFFIAITGAFLTLPWQFGVIVVGYYIVTLGYSLIFKKMVMVDVMVLAVLYTLRIIAGTQAFDVPLTFWLLAFSMFIFLSLALVKRYAELLAARSKGDMQKTGGRGYYPGDLEMIAALGASAGYLSVMVLALYIQDQTTITLYRYPVMIWFACPLLLFWISRTWMLTHRGKMHDDPVIFAIKDKISLLVGLLFGLIFWLAA